MPQSVTVRSSPAWVCQVAMWIIRIKKKQGHPSHLTPRADGEYTVLCMASRPSGQTWPISGPNGICGSSGTTMKSCMKFCSLKHTHVFDCCRDLGVVDALDMSISTPEVMLGIDWDESKHEFRLFYNCSRSSISRVEAVSRCLKESSGIASAQQCFQSAVVELLFGLTLIEMTWPPCGFARWCWISISSSVVQRKLKLSLESIEDCCCLPLEG